MLRTVAETAKRQFRIGLALFLCLSITGCSRAEQAPVPSSAQQCVADRADLERHRVERVIDGDTLQLAGGDSVRLIGVNTPEIGRDGRANEPLARDAQKALAGMLGRSPMVWLQDGEQSRDRYGRRLAYAFDEYGVSLSGRIIALGLGFHVVVAPNGRYAACLQTQEDIARAGRSGIWVDPAFSAKAVRALRPGEGGFARVRDRVTRVSFKENGWWVQMGGKLGVQIDGDARTLFSQKALRALQGREVEVRGWLVPMRGDWWMMNLDHPAMLRSAGD